jgi:hypothetical protein
MRAAPINPPIPRRIPVAGTAKDTNANDSRNANRKTIGRLYPLYSCTSAIVHSVRFAMACLEIERVVTLA